MDEKVFFKEGNVLVTSARFVTGGTTYAMKNITSVMPIKQYQSKVPGIIACWVFGFFGALMILISLIEKKFVMAVIAFLVAAGLIKLMRRHLSRFKPTCIVQIRSASGETPVLTTQDEALFERVMQAVNQAIIHA
jgi:hypothetical protein